MLYKLISSIYIFLLIINKINLIAHLICYQLLVQCISDWQESSVLTDFFYLYSCVGGSVWVMRRAASQCRYVCWASQVSYRQEESMCRLWRRVQQQENVERSHRRRSCQRRWCEMSLSEERITHTSGTPFEWPPWREATPSGNATWQTKSKHECIDFYPWREATPLERPPFWCKRGGLTRGVPRYFRSTNK